MTLPVGASSWIKGGWFGNLYTYPSEMAQNFWTAIFAWTVCFVVTIVDLSLATRPRPPADLVGLVYSLTPRPREEALPWWKTPEGLGALVIAMAIALNLIFW